MHTIAAYPPDFLELAAARAEGVECNALQYLLSSPELLAWLDEYYPDVRQKSDSHAYAHMMRLAAGCFALGWAMAGLLPTGLTLLPDNAPVSFRHSN